MGNEKRERNRCLVSSFRSLVIWCDYLVSSILSSSISFLDQVRSLFIKYQSSADGHTRRGMSLPFRQ